MKDSTREYLSYFGLYSRMFRVKKEFVPEKVSFGAHKDQYFYFYEPGKPISDKIIIWIHGGGWNAGSPKDFDFVGQAVAKSGYRFVSIGYRLSPKNKYPSQIEDVCAGFNSAVKFLKGKNIDTSKLIVSGPSAGAHLSSVMCYSKADQERYGVDVSNVIGYVGWGGPYSFDAPQSSVLKPLLNWVFKKGYDRKNAEPVSLMCRNHIPMLLIQSEHDGVVDFSCAELFEKRAKELGNKCELYKVTDGKNTHSWYTAGMFLLTREERKDLDKFYSFVEEL